MVMRRVIIFTVLSFVLAACQTAPKIDSYITEGVYPGMSKDALLRQKNSPFEVIMLPDGDQVLTYYYQEVVRKPSGFGKKEPPATVGKRLDVVISPEGFVSEMQVDIDPDSLVFTELFQKANAFYQAGDLERALEDFSALIQMCPTCQSARTSRASIYEVQENREAAVEDYRILIHNDPDNHTAFHNLGIYYLENKEFEKAAGMFSQALAIQPGFTMSLASRARANAELGKLDEARRDLNEAQEKGFVLTENRKNSFRQLGLDIE